MQGLRTNIAHGAAVHTPAALSGGAPGYWRGALGRERRMFSAVLAAATRSMAGRVWSAATDVASRNIAWSSPLGRPSSSSMVGMSFFMFSSCVGGRPARPCRTARGETRPDAAHTGAATTVEECPALAAARPFCHDGTQRPPARQRTGRERENSIRTAEDELRGERDDSDLRLTYIVRRPTLTPTICRERGAQARPTRGAR